MNYTVKNDKISIYFAGVVPLDLGDGIVVTPMIFNAQMIPTKAEAERVRKQMPGEGWVISTVSDAETSPNLRRAVR